MAKVAVVGGGMLGLTLALRLRQQGHEVTVLEAAPTTGGLAATHQLGDVSWDRFYHVTLLSDAKLQRLLAEIGVSDQLRWGVTRTGFFGDGRFVSLSSVLDYVRLPFLAPHDKARLAATILLASRISDGIALERESATAWLTRWSGARVVDRTWRPLLRSKLGDHTEAASAAFIWAIIRRMYAARRSGLKREMFGYVEGGYATVLAALERHLGEQGVDVLPSWPVEAVECHDGAVRVRSTDGRVCEADYCVLTISCPRVAAAVPQLRDDERRRLNAVTYQGIVCASMLLDAPLGGYYVTNIIDGGFPFTTVVEMTSLVDRSRFGGQTLVYLPRYATADDEAWRWSDAEVRARFLAGLRRMYPHVADEHVRAFCVSRVRDVLAISTLHYSRDTLPPTRTSLRRVFVANSAQIANGTLNVNETVTLAEAKAQEIAPLLQRTTTLAGTHA